MLAIVQLVVVFVAAIITHAQKWKGQKAVESFQKLIPQEVDVFREGRLKKILAEDLVNGDIVEISAGAQVPADLRIFAAKTLQV